MTADSNLEHAGDLLRRLLNRFVARPIGGDENRLVGARAETTGSETLDRQSRGEGARKTPKPPGAK